MWTPDQTLDQRGPEPTRLGGNYAGALARHQGLLTKADQVRLRQARVAIAGVGGVGGIPLATLARLGIGAFHIADPDSFEIANINRQFGASAKTMGRGKTEVMAETATAINPEIDLRVFNEAINADNVGDFLDGVDVVVDGIDFFAIEARRLLFKDAQARSQWVV